MNLPYACPECGAEYYGKSAAKGCCVTVLRQGCRKEMLRYRDRGGDR